MSERDRWLSRVLLERHERERERLAREIHGELGGLLSTLKLDFARLRRVPGLPPEALEPLQQAHARLDTGIAWKRRVVEELRPAMVEHLGLVPALSALCQAVRERPDTRLAVHVDLDATLQPPRDQALALYRVAQDGLALLSAEVGCTEFSVSLHRWAGGGLELVMMATGPHLQVSAIDAAAEAARDPDFELMRLRADSCGGHLEGVPRHWRVRVPPLPAGDRFG